MKDRTCSVLPFFNCTTAPEMGFSCGSSTSPETIRSLSSCALFLSNESAAEAKQTAISAAATAAGSLLPIFILFLFLFVLVIVADDLFVFLFLLFLLVFEF